MTVVIADTEGFNAKVARIRAAGPASLHIISDFDKTLSPAKNKGKDNTSTWNSFIPFLPPEYHIEHNRQLEMYQPIEFDPTVPLDIKKRKMDEWWRLHLGLLVDMKLTKQIIDKAIASGNILLRDGMKEVMQYASTNNIPFLIFSAGVGDLIKAFLEKENLHTPNVHVISNFFTYTGDDVTGFNDDIVHTFNKSEAQLEDKPYRKEIDARDNLILLGDTIGDASMDAGLKHRTVLKIGFLNDKMDLLEAYTKVFDMVIVEDGGVEEVLKILV